MAPVRIPNQMRTIETDCQQLVIEHGDDQLVLQFVKKKGATLQVRLVGPRSFVYETTPRDPRTIPQKQSD